MFKTNCHGMTLIELLIAITLSISLLSLGEVIYLAFEKYYSTQTALMQIEDASRFSIQILSDNIRKAGHRGCARLQSDRPVPSYGSYSLTKENRLTDYHTSDMKPDTDAFLIQGMGILTVNLLKNMQDSTTVVVGTLPKFKEKDMVMIADCEKAEFFSIRQVSEKNDQQQLIAEKPLQHLYLQNAEVAVFEKNAFFIGKTSRKDNKGAAIYALYSKDSQNVKTELVEGVSNMQIEYSLLNDEGEVVAKKSADNNDWSKAVGVSIILTLTSINVFPLQKEEALYVALRA